MNVRIIAGAFGGRIIEGSGTKRTHPMGERIKNALFNSIGSLVSDAVVLDAFAGSGALGFEALSRGAQKVTMIERDRIAQHIIEKNIATLGVEERVQLIKSMVGSWLNGQLIANGDGAQPKPKPDTELYDLIFVDPPYYDPQLSTALQLSALLKPNGLMVLSYPGRGEVPTGLGVVVVDNRSYGDAALAFYQKESA